MKKSTRRAIVVCVGLGCLLGWMTSVLCLGGVASGTMPDREGSVHDAVFTSVTAAFVVTCMLCSLPPRSWVERLGGRVCMATYAALGIVCASTTLFVGLSIPSVSALYYLSGVLLGAGMAVFLIQWLILLSEFETKTAASALLSAMTVCAIAFVLVHYANKVLCAPMLTSMVAVAFLALSVVALFALRRHIHSVENAVQVSGEMLKRIIVFAFVSSLVAEFLMSFHVDYYGDILFGHDEGAVGRLCLRIKVERIACALCVVVDICLMLILWNRRSKSGYIVLLAYRLAVFAIVMALGCALVQISRLTLPYVTYSFALLGYFLSQIGTWMAALHASRLYESNTVSFIVYSLMFQFLGYGCGLFLAEVLETWFASSAVVAISVLLVLLALWCIVFLFCLTDRHINRLGRVSAAEEETPVALTSMDEKCDEVARRSGLTHREAEVLKLLARGLNSVSIQERLVISNNTVKVHKHNIYSKLGIHSQQELLTLIENLE